MTLTLRLIVATATVAAAAQNCGRFRGEWYDTATEDMMEVLEDVGCMIRTKYGEAEVSGRQVIPKGGVLRAVDATGVYDEVLEEIRWSNGAKWTKSYRRRTEERLAALEAKVASLLDTVDQLRDCCVGGPTPPTTPTTPTTPVTPTTPSTPTSPSTDNATLQSLQELQAQVANITARLDATSGIPGPEGPPGKDGYCTVPPNITDVYIPVTRYVYQKWGGAQNDCVVGGAAWRGAGKSDTRASMKTRAVATSPQCKWSTSMAKEMLAYRGDTLVFARGGDKSGTVYRFKDQKAYDECDFDRATLVAGLLDFEGLEKNGKNLSVELTEAGPLWFGNMNTGAAEPKRSEKCTKKEGRITVMVLEPTEEVLATCPLYDPALYGVNGGPQVDSDSVEKLKGTVAAIGRQIISFETRMQERVREEGNSGVALVRSYGQGTDSYHEISAGTCNIHNHADHHHTIGMGEFSAVLNGVQFTTRHNDYSLVQPDDTLTESEYIGSWPPKAKAIEQPPVPPEVLNAGSVSKQIDEMREWFRAFHTQNVTHRDYRPYFKATLCYLEGTWTESQEDVAEPFASERHHIDADSWSDLNEKTNFLFNSGQKNNLENLPFLPTTFRGMRNTGEDAFQPVLAQWFYRITCKPIEEDLPTDRLRVRNMLHYQMGRWRPTTRKDLSKSGAALFEVNPTTSANYKPGDTWPKGRTSFEFMDELMYNVSGLSGPSAFITDEAFGPMCATYQGGETLNSARYTRYYALKNKDAMGRSTKKRAFNDLMFAAQTNHKRVSPLSVCSVIDDYALKNGPQVDRDRTEECKAIKDKNACTRKWDETEVDPPATGAKCVWARSCVYKKCWSQRWSYAIPLEIIYRTPLSNWNPYNIEYYERGTPEYDEVKEGGRNGKEDKPYKGSRQDAFFRTPASFFQDPKNVDPADTSGSVVYALSKSGTKQAVRASGHWILFPEIEGVGLVRQRYPIFPIHEMGSTVWKETKALEELVMGKDTDDRIRAIIDETRSSAYGAHLRLMNGGGHSHEIYVTAREIKDLKEGRRSRLLKTSSLANGHEHRVQLSFDASAPYGQQWKLDWCSQSVDNCPSSILKTGACGSSPVSCCPGECPDGHPGVEIVL